MRRKEGHPAYRSQSEPPPGRGTTLGGSTDDPRRQRTRTAAARDTTRAGGGQRQRGVPRAGDLTACADRKSTRLNSSHQIISYAVFCLKKKTHKKNTK